MIDRALLPLLAVSLALLLGCKALPEESPPLADMEVSLAAVAEPDDEQERRTLDSGSFTGLRVASARLSLDDPEPAGLLVVEVIENSPGDAARIREDDVLVEATVDGGETVELAWPSQWRSIELAAAPGAEIQVLYDRAGVEQTAVIRPIERVRPAGREAVERFRENQRVGVVLRTATEVEARGCGLGPGGGAVVVGLSRASPWRDAGIVYGDVIVAVDGAPVDHPQVVLDAIRAGKKSIAITCCRGGEAFEFETALTRRKQEFREFDIPVLVSYERDANGSNFSLLLGLFGLESTPAAWRCRILWFITFGGGDADRLQEVPSP